MQWYRDFSNYLAAFFECKTKQLFKKMGQSRPLFVYFRPFLITISIIQIEKSLGGVLGIQTCVRRMAGADKTTELWRLPKNTTLPFLQIPQVWITLRHIFRGPKWLHFYQFDFVKFTWCDSLFCVQLQMCWVWKTVDLSGHGKRP